MIVKLFTTSIKFPNIFDLTSGNTNTDNEYVSINRCLALLLTTAKGELLGDPDFGCTLYERLFNGYTTSEAADIKDDIVDSIAKYEKRIVVNTTDINIEPIDIEQHKFKISIKYRLQNSDLYSTAYVDIDTDKESST
jgi:phage baseplate assembly protein W